MDSKVRTRDARVLVGGNAANTAAALARLGAHCRLLSKVGGDANAKFLLSSLSFSMGVVVDDVITSEDSTSVTGFTYVIVCQQSLSRTCIHTPLQSEISLADISKYAEKLAMYDDFEYVHFDSRHTEAAAALAAHIHCNASGKVLSVDVEKSRPHLQSLIPFCHVIFTNKKGIADVFPSFSGATDEDYLLQAASFFNETEGGGSGRDGGCCCKLVVVTDGSKGSSVMFQLANPMGEVEADSSFAWVRFQELLEPGCSVPELCDSALRESFDAILRDALQAKYATLQSRDSCRRFGVIRCSAFSVPATDIADTTGAGDAFIGAFLFGLASQRFSLQECMVLGTIVATEKLYCLGAQTNLPSLARVLDVVTTRASGTYVKTHN